MIDSIHQLIRDAEQNYVKGSTKIGDYVTWDMHEVIQKITAYLNSKHISGERDSLGREKPFFNIVTAAVNIWYRATDIDRKDITVQASKTTDIAIAFVAQVHLHEWMKTARFGVFLNEWGRVLSRYGSAVVKFVEQSGELKASVISWHNLIVDPVDFDALPRIEKFYKTPAQLQNMATEGHPDYAGYDMEVVKSLIEAGTTRKDLEGSNIDNKDDFIELYEVHGELPESLLIDGDPTEAQEENFVQQMHVVSYTQDENDEFKDFSLFKGKEAKDPYMLTHLIKEDSRTLSIGAVESLFDVQWMQNHSMKNMKDTLDIASKILFQTSDKRFAGRNVLSNLETGGIFIHDMNQPLTKVDNSKSDLVAQQAFASEWRVLGQELTATPEATRGITPVSGTPLGTTQLLVSQSNSLFEIMTENKGLAVEDMLTIHILPHIKKKMDNKGEISATLEAHDIDKIDAMYIPREAVRRFNDRTIETVLNGGEPEPFDQEFEQQGVKETLAPLGNQRFFSPGDITWSKTLKDFEWKFDISVTNEQKDKQVILTTLASILQLVVQNPEGFNNNPRAKMILNKALALTGEVSPVELSVPNAAPVPAQPAPAPTKPLEALTTNKQ